MELTDQQMLDGVLGVIENGILVCSVTKLPITKVSLLSTKFEDIWVSVSMSNKDNTIQVHECDTLFQALLFMDKQEVKDGETLFASFMVNRMNPTKLITTMGNIEAITKYLNTDKIN